MDPGPLTPREARVQQILEPRDWRPGPFTDQAAIPPPGVHPAWDKRAWVSWGLSFGRWLRTSGLLQGEEDVQEVVDAIVTGAREEPARVTQEETAPAGRVGGQPRRAQQGPQGPDPWQRGAAGGDPWSQPAAIVALNNANPKSAR